MVARRARSRGQRSLRCCHYSAGVTSKTKRLRLTADGFMAGLVANGYRGPWRWAHHEWESSFYRAWDTWAPAQQRPADFPYFRLGGGAGRTSQPRDMLWQLKRTSPFAAYDTEVLPAEPIRLTPQQFLEIWVDIAQPEAWVALAAAFLDEVHGREGSE